jgi:5-oxopent-3-ene-1,2,5-tricarboxylate decarboxylase / 2-hydroxyhepta-2,4-diene-1,7-dioate isomerase
MLPSAGLQSIAVDTAPYRLSGVVYGALLNHRSALAVLGDSVNKPPYKAPPRAPVLYLKPRNTLAGTGDEVIIPRGCPELEVAACLGVVIGRTACRISVAEALGYIGGFLIVNDVSVPHESLYRPSVREKARDGFCPMGPAVAVRDAIPNPDAVVLRTFIDGMLVQSASTQDLIRPVARLLADVTEFMTLAPGDVLCLGAAAPAPRVRAGQTVTIEIAGLGSLTNRIVGEGA